MKGSGRSVTTSVIILPGACSGKDGRFTESLDAIEGEVFFACDGKPGVLLNQAAGRATGEFLLFLTGRRPFRGEQLERLESLLRSDGVVGMAGLPSLEEGGLEALFFLTAADVSRLEPDERQPFPVQRVPLDFMLLRRSVFKKSGGFAEDLALKEFLAADLCRRARAAGAKIFLLPGPSHPAQGRRTSLTQSYAGSVAHFSDRAHLVRRWFPAAGGSVACDAAPPLVSVLMTTYNRRLTLQRAVESVLRQSYGKLELIIVNDGGEDVADIVEGFRDERLRYIPLAENRGKSAALNEAVRRSTGPVVAYLDDDDRFLPHHLATAVEALAQASSRRLIYTGAVEVRCTRKGGDVRIAGRKVCSHEFDRSILQRVDNNIPNLSVVHRRELFDRAGLYDESLPCLEDWDLLRRFCACTDFHHVPEVTGEFHVYLDGASRNTVLQKRQKEWERVKDNIRGRDLTAFGQVTAGALVDEGKRLEEEGALEEALSRYREALELDGGHPFALERMGRLLAESPHGRQYLEKSLALRPDRSSAHLALSEILLKEGDHAPALEHLEAALLLSDDGREAGSAIYRHTASCCSARGEVPTSKAHLGKAESLRLFRYLEEGRPYRFLSRLLLLIHPLINRDRVLAHLIERRTPRAEGP